MRIVKPSVELLAIYPDITKMIEKAGRTCYKSEYKITDESADVFVKMLISRGHEAMVEHAVATLKFVCDRGVTHEMVRHRIASFAQESTRYCNYASEKLGKEITVIEPPFNNQEERDIWYGATVLAEDYYMRLIEKKVKPEIARSVLPNCLKTEIVVTANMREWRHILKLRTSKAAHPQIKEVMLIALDILKKEAPAVFEDIVPEV